MSDEARIVGDWADDLFNLLRRGSDQTRPYSAALLALATLTSVPPDVLRQLADGVLRIINDNQPGVARAAAQLRARTTLAAMLRSIAEDSERVERAGREDT